MTGPPVIRVAVRVARDGISRWHERAVAALRAVPGARVALVLVSDGGRSAPRARADAGLVGVSLDDLAGDAPRVGDRDGALPRGDAVDVLLDLAGDGAPRPAITTPRFGVWRYGFGDGGPSAGGAPGTLARLYRATADRDHGVLLYEGWFKAATRSLSLRVAPWAARVLRRAADDDAGIVAAPARWIGDTLASDPCGDARSWRAHLAGIAAGWLSRERWTIGVIPLGIAEILQRGRLPEPRWLRGQPRDRYYADPFPIARSGDRIRVLAEDYRYRTGTGRVSELDIGPDGDLVATRVRLTPPVHTSYPFLLRVDGGLFCVPETARARRVSAFAYDPAADAWQPHLTLVDGVAAADPTLVRHDGRWWLFCTDRDDENQTDLHVFCAPEWTGPWTPHPWNPVKSDARSSRPAGAFFTVDGRLYRPAQDCARRYGAAVAINRVTELSLRAFREEPVMTLAPSPASPWPAGLHTVNGADGVTVVDALRIDARLGRLAGSGGRARSDDGELRVDQVAVDR